jgi:predicted ATPase
VVGLCYTETAMSWSISLLGKMSATRENVTLTHFESSRVVALLARLVLFPSRTHPREELAELLWPEIEPERGRERLRHVLRTLRTPLEKGLSPGSVLVTDRLSVSINPAVVVTDVAAFEQAVKQKDFETARSLYTGELLPGLWDDWILEERHRLAALAESLAECAPSPAVRERPAPLRSGGGSGTVPPYLTAFFGREAEHTAISELLSRCRLVTVTGLGGTGKTRLATEIFRRHASRFSEVAFVALGECVSAAQIAGRIRDALGIPPTSTDPLEQVCWKLSESTALLVLDNLEQLIDSGGSEVIEILLARLPQLTVLVTSRRMLGTDGERLLPLQPLPEADAVALFLDRVQASRPGFRLTDGNRADVLAVCQGLEGIPLAIELAAARIRAFSVSEMRAELTSRFDWLARAGLKGHKDDRHRSLAATLEWSWRLLPAAQQRFLATLALFRAPFTAEEAAAVSDYADARERLEALVADSLVALVADDSKTGAARFSLLETVREFALARLEDAPAARKRFRTRYLTHPTRDENSPTAWEFALADEDGEDAHAFANRTDADWTGWLRVARTKGLLARTHALPCADPLLAVKTAYELASCIARDADRQGAMALMAEAVALLEEVGGEVLAEGLRLQAAVGQFDVPLATTLALLDRCLSLTEDPLRRADALRLKGAQFLWTSDFEAASPLFDEVARLYPPDARGQRLLLDNRSHLARRRGQHEECLRFNQLATAQALAVGDSQLARNCQANLPTILTHLERWEESIIQARRCVDVEEANGDRFQLLSVLWNMAYPFLKMGEAERATRLQSATAAIWVRDVRPLSEEDFADLEEFRAELAEALDEEAFARAWAEGETLTLKETIALVRESER